MYGNSKCCFCEVLNLDSYFKRVLNPSLNLRFDIRMRHCGSFYSLLSY